MTTRKAATLRMIRRLLESVLYRSEPRPEFRVVDCGRYGLVEQDTNTGAYRFVGPSDARGQW